MTAARLRARFTLTPAWRNVLGQFVGLRLLTLAWVIALSLLLPAAAPAMGPGVLPTPAYLQADTPGERMLISPWYRWDTAHYLEIATAGYTRVENTVWPPLYPLAVWLVGRIVPQPVLAALLVSNLCALIFLYLLHREVAARFDDRLAGETLFLLISFPTAFFLLAGYSESLFLALVLGFFGALRGRHWLTAGLLAALATLTRNQGLLLVLPLAWEVWQNRAVLTPGSGMRGLTALALPPLAFGGFAQFVHFMLAAPWPWQSLGGGWEQHFGWPWEGLTGNLRALIVMAGGGPVVPPGTTVYDLLIALTALMMLGLCARRLPPVWQLYAWPALILSLSKVTNGHLLVSTSRYALALFPLFAALALLLQNKPRAKIAWFAVSAFSQVLFLALFYWGNWVG